MQQWTLSACAVLSAVPEPFNASASYRRRLLSSGVLDESRTQVEEQLSGSHRAKLQASQHSATPFLQQHILANAVSRKSIKDAIYKAPLKVLCCYLS